MQIRKPFNECRILLLSTPEQRAADPRITEKAPDGEVFPRGHHSAIPCPDIIERNYGIALDNQFVVMDIDSPKDCDDVGIVPTWSQATKKGTHYVYKAPPNFNGQNRKLKNKQGKIYGDLKCKGYIVGPGSVIADFHYHVIDSQEPQECPAYLLRLMERAESLDSGDEAEGVSSGEHDAFLTALAGWLRGRYAFSESAIAKVLHKGPLQALQDVDPTRPYTQDDLKRIAHSIARKDAVHANVSLSPSGWESYTDIDTMMPLNDWWIYRFVPKNELVMLYGKGGIGKSSLASYIASEVIRSGKTIGFAGIEEPFLRFATRAALAYPDATEIALNGLINIGSTWQFPRDAVALREALLVRPLDVVYFDSIYGHFEAVEGLNTAERARHCLAPLAAIAQELGVTIVCTFHENKAGDFLGSVEMVNVARIVLHATREKDQDLKLTVKKTNFTEPDHSLSFSGALIPGRSRDGEPWEEKNEHGEIVPLELFIIQERRKSTGAVEYEEQTDPRWEKILPYIQQGLPHVWIAKELDIPRSTLQDIINREGKIKTLGSIDLDLI